MARGTRRGTENRSRHKRGSLPAIFKDNLPMDKRTNFKVTLITIMSVIVGLIYVNRGQLINEFKMWWQWKDWKRNEPTGQMTDGKKNGKWTTTYKNGQLETEENYINDALNGRQLIYYPSGQLRIKRNYLKGKQIDSAIWYHSNGQVHIKEFRDSMGQQQGLSRIFYQNGRPSYIGYFKDGMLHGESRGFFDNGQLWDIGKYVMNKKVGTWLEFSRTGDTVKVEKF